MNLRRLKNLFVIVASFAFLTPNALSSYLFNGVEIGSTEVAPNAYYADNVTENAHFDDNVFDVYYFASPVYANYFSSLSDSDRANKSVDDLISLATSSYEKYAANLFTSSIQSATGVQLRSGASAVDALGYFLDDSNTKSYGYIKQTAYGTLSPDFINAVSKPITGANDQTGWPVRFSGWTSSLTNAMKYGYSTQGSYDYIGSEDSLQAIDEKALDSSKTGVTSSVDGSNVEIAGSSAKGDRTIFLYPVFTAGKEYKPANVTGNGFQSVARIHSDEVEYVDDPKETGNNNYTYFTTEYYLAQEGYNNSATYFFNNLYVDEGDLLYLDFSPVKWNSGNNSSLGEHGGDWYNYQCTGYNYKTKDYTWSNSNGIKASYDPNDTENGLVPLFDTTGKTRKTALVSEPGIYNIYVYFNRIGSYWGSRTGRSDSSFGKKDLYDQTFVYFDSDSDSSYSTYVTLSNGRNSDYYAIALKIEKVYDFRLVGPNGSMKYSSSSSRLVQLENTSDLKTQSNAIEAYYRADGVSIESSSGKRRFAEGNYSYFSSIFTILENETSVCSFQAMSEDILTKFNEWSSKNYHRKNEFLVAGSDKFYNLIDPQDEDNYVTNKNSFPFGSDLNDSESNFVNVQSSGKYDIAIYVVFTYDTSTSGSSKKITMSEAYVAMAKTVTNGVSVAIYDSREAPSTTEINGTTFVNITEGWIGKISLNEGATFGNDSTIKLADGSEKTFSEFMRGYSEYSLYDCLTDTPLIRSSGSSIPIRKSYAAYLKK